MKIGEVGDDWRVELNLAPMIDVIFLLIIFFLVSTRFAQEERDFRVNPPASKVALPLTAPRRRLVINITQDGRYFVGGRRYSLKELDHFLSEAAARNPDQTVIIRGDKRVPLEVPVNVLALCEKYKLRRKYLTVSPKGP